MLQSREVVISMQSNKNSHLVYSTDQGKVCQNCGQPVAQCTCGSKSTRPKTDGIVRISRQTKGRKGKGVSCVTGIPLPQEKLEELAKQLKQRCGAGGTVKDGIIEIQGDHREALALALQKLGYCVKLAGG
jgi:translation initiation factor 1